MNLEEWKEFWAYLVGDMAIVEQMGSNRFDSVGEFLEWQRQEWIKLHEEIDFGAQVRAGQKVIQSMEETQA